MRIRLVALLLLSTSLYGSSRDVVAQSRSTAMLDSIRTAYQRIDFTAARGHIETALQAFEQFTPAQLTEVHTYFAQVLFAEDDRSGARQQLMLALQLSPEMRLDPLQASPKLMALFDEVVAELAREPGTGVAEPGVRYLVVEDPRSGAAMRSMLLPGWGQLHKDEPRKGAVLMGIWGVTAGGAIAAHLLRQRAAERYNDATLPEDIQDRYQTYNTWHLVRNNLFFSAVGVWAFSYVDALLLWKKPTPGVQSAGLQLRPLRGQSHLTLSVRF